MMKTQNELIHAIEKSSFYGPKWLKMKSTSQQYVITFLKDNFEHDRDLFEFKANRYFVDQIDKPKDWAMICELLSVINNMRKT